MVARLLKDGHDTGYMLIDDKYNIRSVGVQECYNLAMSGLVKNLGVKDGSIISTNGALKRYTCIDVSTNTLCSYPRAVVLSRVEKNGKLIGYNIFCKDSIVRFANVEIAVHMVKLDDVVNGKLRTTENGTIVSSIKGEYDIAEMGGNKSEEDNSKIKVKIVMLRSVIGDNNSVIRAATIALNYSNANKMRKHMELLEECNIKLDKKIGNSIEDDIPEEVMSTLVTKSCGTMIVSEILYDDFKQFMRTNNIDLESNIPGDGVVVACRDSKGNESAIQLDEKPKILGRGTENTDKECKEYAHEIMNNLHKLA